MKIKTFIKKSYLIQNMSGKKLSEMVQSSIPLTYMHDPVQGNQPTFTPNTYNLQGGVIIFIDDLGYPQVHLSKNPTLTKEEKTLLINGFQKDERLYVPFSHGDSYHLQDLLKETSVRKNMSQPKSHVILLGASPGELLYPFSETIPQNDYQKAFEVIDVLKKQYGPNLTELASAGPVSMLVQKLKSEEVEEITVLGSYGHVCVASAILTGLHHDMKVKVPEKGVIYDKGTSMPLNDFIQLITPLEYNYKFENGHHLFSKSNHRVLH